MRLGEVNKLQLEEIVKRIDDAFGEPLPFSAEAFDSEQFSVLERLFGDDIYQTYMQDQHNRQIIRDYLTNAVILDLLTEEELASFGEQVSTEQGRAQLSLHMLMSSVEEAPNLAAESQAPALAPLKPSPGSPPHMKLVPNQGPGTS